MMALILKCREGFTDKVMGFLSNYTPQGIGSLLNKFRLVLKNFNLGHVLRVSGNLTKVFFLKCASFENEDLDREISYLLMLF